jgi:6-phosphogluconolactonase
MLRGVMLFVANYGGGSIAVLPILDGGSLGAATDIHRDSGTWAKRRPPMRPRAVLR